MRYVIIHQGKISRGVKSGDRGAQETSTKREINRFEMTVLIIAIAVCDGPSLVETTCPHLPFLSLNILDTFLVIVSCYCHSSSATILEKLVYQ